MIYQLAKTSVGLSGQVKWDMIINSSKVVDLQIVPIHEEIAFNHTKREDTLNHTHIQNLQKLYKKISSQFFQPVVSARLCTGYPVRNNGVRVETHENTYEMGMKRNKSYQRYGKQFSFFCPIWCDDINEINNLEFEIVVENNNPKKLNPSDFFKGEVICKRVIDHSILDDYLRQYTLDANLNPDLIYISFGKSESWITGVNVEDGVVQTKDTLGIIHDLTSQERPMMEVDNMLLSQFSKRKMIARQLFNFNFNFNMGDIIAPSLLSSMAGQMVNVYVDVYVKDLKSGTRRKVEFRDIYSNYDKIPRYDISNNTYIGLNCLDYLQDYSNVDLIGQNKLVQNTFHWALSENPNYLFNLYDGCCPVYTTTDADGNEIRYNCNGMYFDTPDTSVSGYNKMKNPLGWVKPYIGQIGLSQQEIVYDIKNIIDNGKPGYGVRYCNESESGEFFWRNNVKYKTKLPKVANGEIGRVDDLTVYYLYYPNPFYERKEIRGFFKEYCNLADPFEEPSSKSNGFYFEHVIEDNDYDAWANDKRQGCIFYTILCKSNNDELDTLIFVMLDDRKNYAINYLDNQAWNEYFTVSAITKGFDRSVYDSYSLGKKVDWEDSLTILTYRSVNAHVDISGLDLQDQIDIRAAANQYGNLNSEQSIMLRNTMRSMIRTIVDNLNNIVQPEVISFQTSIIPESINRPKQMSKWYDSKDEHVYYKTDNFSYVLRYDGKLSPLFIDGKTPSLKSQKDKHPSPILYNMVYVTKQFNQQANVIDVSDDDMVDFNTYANSKFAPVYPSLDYFPLRKKRCKYGIYHRGTRRYYWEKSWFKKNALYVLPETVEMTRVESELTEDKIKTYLRNFISSKLNWVLKGNKTLKKQLVFDNFIFPLYDYSYTFDYVNNETIDKYVYKIKYTLK